MSKAFTGKISRFIRFETDQGGDFAVYRDESYINGEVVESSPDYRNKLGPVQVTECYPGKVVVYRTANDVTIPGGRPIISLDKNGRWRPSFEVGEEKPEYKVFYQPEHVQRMWKEEGKNCPKCAIIGG